MLASARRAVDLSRVKPIALAVAPMIAAAMAFIFLGEEFLAKKQPGLLLAEGRVGPLTTHDGPGH